MSSIYNDLFTDAKEVISQFSAPEDALDNATVFYANYSYEDYSGCAHVIFEKDGKLFEVHGSHCSCYGLEGQWEPEETSWAAIEKYADKTTKAIAQGQIKKAAANNAAPSSFGFPVELDQALLELNGMPEEYRKGMTLGASLYVDGLQMAYDKLKAVAA